VLVCSYGCGAEGTLAKGEDGCLGDHESKIAGLETFEDAVNYAVTYGMSAEMVWAGAADLQRCLRLPPLLLLHLSVLPDLALTLWAKISWCLPPSKLSY